MSTRIVLALTLMLAACGTSGIVAVPDDGQSRTVMASVGQEIQVTLGNVGPGTYDSPPVISSSAVTFIDEAVVPPYNPGGPTQRFRFRASRAGDAVIQFPRIQIDASVRIVEDTVHVR